MFFQSPGALAQSDLQKFPCFWLAIAKVVAFLASDAAGNGGRLQRPGKKMPPRCHAEATFAPPRLADFRNHAASLPRSDGSASPAAIAAGLAFICAKLYQGKCVYITCR